MRQMGLTASIDEGERGPISRIQQRPNVRQVARTFVCWWCISFGIGNDLALANPLQFHERQKTASTDGDCGYSGSRAVFISLHNAAGKAPFFDCAIESAILKAGSDNVVVLVDDLEAFSQSWTSAYPCPGRLVDLERCFAHTPFLHWLHSPELQSAQFKDQDIADALRLAVMYKQGGIYLDLDIITLQRELVSLQGGAVSLQWESELNNAYLNFPPNHPFVSMMLLSFVYNFYSEWGHNGPEMVSDVYYRKLRCDDTTTAHSACKGLTILPTERVAPFHYSQVEEIVSSLPSEGLFDAHNSSYWGLHLYNHVWKKQCVVQGSMLHHVMLEHCPVVAATKLVDVMCAPKSEPEDV